MSAVFSVSRDASKLARFATECGGDLGRLPRVGPLGIGPTLGCIPKPRWGFQRGRRQWAHGGLGSSWLVARAKAVSRCACHRSPRRGGFWGMGWRDARCGLSFRHGRGPCRNFLENVAVFCGKGDARKLARFATECCLILCASTQGRPSGNRANPGLFSETPLGF